VIVDDKKNIYFPLQVNRIFTSWYRDCKTCISWASLVLKPESPPLGVGSMSLVAKL